MLSGGTLHGSRICWTASGLPSGATRTFTLRVRAVASRTRVVINDATVSAPGTATRSARATVVIINPVPRFTG
jgi:hypothetical protein